MEPGPALGQGSAVSSLPQAGLGDSANDFLAGGQAAAPPSWQPGHVWLHRNTRSLGPCARGDHTSGPP